jgi:putative flippase GtrA
LKFNAVGGIGIGVQLVVLTVLRSWLKLDYLLATGLAVEIAAIHNFLWHERFTWADRPATRPVQSLVRLAKFNASNGAVSLVGNLVLMRLLVGELKFSYVASNLLAIVLCALLNFLLSDRLVFDGEAKPAAISTLAAAELCSAGRTRASAPTWFVESAGGFLDAAFGVCLWGLRGDQSRDIMN